ncbi:MAG: DUF1273 family protein [Alistipes sp.]|nr:DUF1273 family protein [Alistipes sp.]MBP3456001.1 DUF1273 family protein [Alistipes sp.]
MTHLAISVAFTGHRYYDGRDDGVLCDRLERLYAEGYRRFVSGMAPGFDLAAAEAVAALRERHADAVLECAVPYPGFESGFAVKDCERFRALIAAADRVVYIGESYSPHVFHRRNDYLVDNCSLMVAWWDGRRSGTGYTVARARRMGRCVVNIFSDGQPALF